MGLNVVPIEVIVNIRPKISMVPLNQLKTEGESKAMVDAIPTKTGKHFEMESETRAARSSKLPCDGIC